MIGGLLACLVILLLVLGFYHYKSPEDTKETFSDLNIGKTDITSYKVANGEIYGKPCENGLLVYGYYNKDYDEYYAMGIPSIFNIKEGVLQPGKSLINSIESNISRRDVDLVTDLLYVLDKNDIDDKLSIYS